MDEYRAAWREAVRVFGRNRVSTYLLVGLGEDPDELVAGAGELIDMGVYPFVVPYRPLAGTLATDVDGVAAPPARRSCRRHRAASADAPARGRHARRRPGGRLRRVRRLQRPADGGGLSDDAS